MTDLQDRCAHKTCTCALDPSTAVSHGGERYCSERCADHRGCDHHDCNCGAFPTEEPARQSMT